MDYQIRAPATNSTKPPPRLLDQVRAAIRTNHYSQRTEEAYVHWARHFILFHGKRHPIEMGEVEVGQFLQHLALNKGVAASTQNQALNALLFLYGSVLNKPLGKLPKLRQNSPAVFPPKSKPPFGGLLRPAKNPARFSTSNPVYFRGVHSVQALTHPRNRPMRS